MSRINDVTVVIGDAHIHPNQMTRDGLRRFRWLDRYLGDVKPRRVVVIGDFVTYDSLSPWDRDKRRLLEGKRYIKDIDAANAALSLLPNLDKQEFIYEEGNHEEWVQRYIDQHPEMETHINPRAQLNVPKHTVWGKYRNGGYTYKGVTFTHVPIMENGRPISGKNAVYRALDIYHNSVVFGHTHHLAFACVARHNSPHLNQAINVGCFFEHIDDYAIGSVTSYWRGIVALNHVSHNRVDMETVSLSQLRNEYGERLQ